MKRAVLIIAAVMLVAGGLLGWRYYDWIFAPAVTVQADESPLLIVDGTTVDEIATGLESNGQIESARAFLWVAKRMSFSDESVKVGRYLLTPGHSNREVIQMLRLGEQAPVQLVVRASLTLERLAGRLADQLMIDSTELIGYIKEEYLPSSSTYEESTILSLFIPNTYEVYWNVSPAGLMKRMETEHERFWNEDRKNLAAKHGLDPLDVYTLASIIERETYIDSERPVVAGVYLNRLELNMPLQADPTVHYALGDFGIKRLLYKHLEVDSPYNTYKNPGLPPGPIAMPSMASIQAILQPEDHNYLYFCLKPGGGGHLFAESISQHNRNARSYHSWLDAQGIR